jgi:oligopeptide transport system substrate-binding protein
MVKQNEGFSVSRRDFLKTAGMLGLLTAAGSAIPMTLFEASCSSNSGPTGPQELNVNLAGEPDTMDPNAASWAGDISAITRLSQGLLSFNPDLSVTNMCATAIPTVGNGGISSDGKTYTFKLKSNVTWSDGTKVLAKDYVYSIKRMLSPDTASEYASFYTGPSQAGEIIAGSFAYNAATNADAATKTTLAANVGVSAPDDGTLVVKLTNPLATFLDLMALWCVVPVREDIITKYGASWTEANNYMGNGPYVLSEWEHNDHMTFSINTNYWGTKPKLTKVTYKMITDPNAALAAFENSELDLVGVPPGTEKATLADPTLGPEVLRYNTLTTYAFQFNCKHAPFDNVKVRQGLSCAVDRDAFVNQVRNGVGKPALSWIPPGMPGYNATIGTDWAFNVTKAKQLLSDAGYPDLSKLPALNFQYNNTAGNTTIAQFLQGQLSTNLGLNLNLQPMDSKSFQSLVNANQEDWAFFGWGADYPDPDDWLPQLFGTGAGNNHTNYSNPQFDALAAKALVELDNTKRLQEWDQAQTMVMADAPILTMFFREVFSVVHPWVKGLTTTGMDNQIAGDRFYELVSIQKSSTTAAST